MKKFCAAAALCCALFTLNAQSKKSALTLKNEALKQETVLDSIAYLKTNLDLCETQSDRRSILYFTATLQEQLGLFTDATSSYAKAAGIASANAAGMNDVTTEQIVIDAVRAALCGGDWETANSYLGSSVRLSKNENILALVNLYTIWSSLCKAGSKEETMDSVALLHAYSMMQSMKSVRPSVLLTLWYLTGNESYGAKIKNEYPSSPEAGIVTGRVQIASVPFWYFVPRGEVKFTPPAEEKIAERSVPAAPKTAEASQKPSSTSAKKADTGSYSSGSIMREKSEGKKQQLGFYKAQSNAEEKVRQARAKGFDAYCYTEQRSSGTTYFVVVVDENSTLTMGPKLKEAGIESYTIK